MMLRASLFAPLTVALALASAACGEPPLPTAIAARRSQLGTQIPNAELASAPADPETLLLMLGSNGRTCADPFLDDLAHDLECADYWRVSIAVPPALGQPGTIELASPDIVNGFMRVIPRESGCLVEGDAFTVGTLEITSIDKTKVAFRLKGAANPGISSGDGVVPLDPDGDYTAALCP